MSFTTLAAETGANDSNTVLLAVDSTHVYFAYGSALMSVPLRGGPVATLARLPNDGLPIVTSEGVVLAVPTGGVGGALAGPLLRIPASGAPVVTMAPTVAGVTIDDTWVYYSDFTGIFSLVKTYEPDGG